MDKKILIVSDIHQNKELAKRFNELEGFDLKVYLGDLDLNYNLLSDFDYIVKGNKEIDEKNEETIVFEFEGYKFLMVHGHLWTDFTGKIDFNKLYYAAKELNVDFVLHGHDHIKANEEMDETIKRFNPGSTTMPLDGEKGSFGVFSIDEEKNTKFEHIFI